MADKVRIEQELFDEPVRVKLRGTATLVMVLLLFSIAMNTCSTEQATREGNKINKERLELAKRQYALDSVRFEHIKSHQK